MNILELIIGFIPSTFGGIKNHTYHQAKEMLKHGHTVEVCTSNAYSRTENHGRIGTDSIDGIKVKYFKRLFPSLKYLNTMYLMPALIPYLRKNINKFDVVHLHDFRTFPNIVAYCYARRHGIPYVLSAHGTVPRGSFLKVVKKWIFDMVLGYKMLKNASRLIALSELEVKEYQNAGVPKDKITIIPNGVDPEEISGSLKPGYFKRKYKINETFLISFVGRIHKMKSLDFLAKSFAEILKEEPSSRLVIAGGDHGYLNELQRILRRLGIVDKVLFPGYLSGPKKWALYWDSDIFVLPSKQESFGIVVPEAAFCETPIVLSDGCAIANQVQENGFGIVVPFGNVKKLSSAMLRILSDDQVRKEMGKDGKRFVLENWTWELSAKILLDVYSEVLMRKQKI